jgi:hypothetical protein
MFREIAELPQRESAMLMRKSARRSWLTSCVVASREGTGKFQVRG